MLLNLGTAWEQRAGVDREPRGEGMQREAVRSLCVRAVLVAVLLASVAAVASAAPSEYFPDVLSCGSWPDRLVPPPDVLAQAATAAPTPLFAESFQSLARSAIAPKWLAEPSQSFQRWCRLAGPRELYNPTLRRERRRLAV